MTQADWPRFLLRLPHDAKSFLKEEADRNASSLNSEILRCIRERMSVQQARLGYISNKTGHAEHSQGRPLTGSS